MARERNRGKRGGKRKPLPDRVWLQVYNLAATGESQRGIAKKLRLSRRSVQIVLERRLILFNDKPYRCQQQRQPPYRPTPEQIALETTRIQLSWTDAERDGRWQGLPRGPY